VNKISRREFIHISALAAAGVTLAACAKATEAPQEVPTATTAPKVEEVKPTATPVPEAKPAENEAPALAEMVASGALPPLDERLPAQPMVVGPGVLVMPMIIPAYVDMLEAVSRQGQAGYAMIFDQVPSTWRREGCNSVHSIELPYVFGDYDDTTGWWKSVWMLARQSGAETIDPGLTGTDRVVSEAVMALWTSFAKDGKPKAESVADWPAYDEKDRYLYVNEGLEIKSGFSKIS